MPAPRPERRENPLLKLRTILGNEEKPLRQVEFAQLTSIPVATVRAIESGARQMTWENSRERIGYLLGANFDERDGEWHYMHTKHLYTAELYKAFTEERRVDPFLKAKCLHALFWRTLDLFRVVPHKRWLAFFGCVMSKLKEVADEFEIKGRSKILDETEPRWGLSFRVQDQDGKRYPPDALPQVITYFRCLNRQSDEALRAKDAGGLLDFRQWREFDSAGSAPDFQLGARETM